MPALDLFPTGRPPGCTSGVSNVAGVTSATKIRVHSVTGAHNRPCCKHHVSNKPQRAYQENNNLIKNLWKKTPKCSIQLCLNLQTRFWPHLRHFSPAGRNSQDSPTAQYICHPKPCLCQQKQQQSKLSPGQGQHLQWGRKGQHLVTLPFVTRKPLT